MKNHIGNFTLLRVISSILFKCHPKIHSLIREDIVIISQLIRMSKEIHEFNNEVGDMEHQVIKRFKGLTLNNNNFN